MLTLACCGVCFGFVVLVCLVGWFKWLFGLVLCWFSCFDNRLVFRWWVVLFVCFVVVCSCLICE